MVIAGPSGKMSIMPESTPIEWTVSAELVPYGVALEAMEGRVAAILEGRAFERIWLLEHPALYTAGTSARSGDLRSGDLRSGDLRSGGLRSGDLRSGDLRGVASLPVFRAGRGGQYTYHGPGQRVAYVMLDLRRRGRDVRAFVHGLEGWIIDALGFLGVEGERRAGRVGVWVRRSERGVGHEDKIAAIGVRLRRWVSFHGLSLNVAPDLGHYRGIVPCGIADPRLGVTSFADLGVAAGMAEVDAALRKAFEERFGPTRTLAPQEAPGADLAPPR